MYSRGAYPIANMLADLPFSATRIFIYNVVIYFMTHLDRSAGGFWTFHLMVYLTFLVMQAFFRAFGLIFHDFDTAFRISVLFFLHILQYVGLWVPLGAMKRWLFWIVSYFCRDPWRYRTHSLPFSLTVLYQSSRIRCAIKRFISSVHTG